MRGLRLGALGLGALLALSGPVAAQTSAGSPTSLPPITEPTPVSGNAALLLDGQRLSIRVSFAPGTGDGPAYPPLRPFSRAAPAYYPMQGPDEPFRLSVQSALSGATLVLRAQPVALPGSPGVPVDRIEYSVNGAPFQPARAVQLIALLPASGAGTYDIALRLRLEGDEPAGTSEILLSWSLEAR